MKETKQCVLWLTPFGLTSAVVWAMDSIDSKILYWAGFVLFALTFSLAGHGLVKLDEDLDGNN